MAMGNKPFPHFREWLSNKESACQAGEVGLILGSGRCPGEGNGNLLQYSCPGNPEQRNLVGPWGCRRAGHDLATKH